MKNNTLLIYVDGGARGNPGPAAIGAVIGDREYAKQIGDATNNIAEYQVIIFALKKAKHLLGKENAKKAELEIRSDSELAIKQLKGEYKIKNTELQQLFITIWNLKQDFKVVRFTQIPREKNKVADRLVNQALNTFL